MSWSNLRIMVGMIAWGLVAFSTLSIAQWRVDWGHGVCGPWGCGPPLQALLACHLTWFVVLLPLATLLRIALTMNQQRLLASLIVAIGFVVLVGVVVFELITWWPIATEMHRGYLLQRLGFVVVTHVDLPLTQFVVAGMIIGIPAKPWSLISNCCFRRAASHRGSNESDHECESRGWGGST